MAHHQPKHGPGKRLMLGLTIGVALGLLFDSVLLVATTAWAIAFVWPMVLPVLMGACLGISLGVTRLLPALNYRQIVVLTTVVWICCAVGPIAARHAQFRWMIWRDLPRYPGSEQVEVATTVLAMDDTPGFGVLLRSKADLVELERFYQQELVQCGWKYRGTEDRGYRWSVFDRGNRRMFLFFLEGPMQYSALTGHPLSALKDEGWNWVRVNCDVYNFTYRLSDVHLPAKNDSAEAQTDF